MITLKGKYNTANVYTDNIAQAAITQIIELCNQEFTKDCKVAIMPDVHAGKGCTIGTTLEIKDKVVPNLVGVDIGCGMFTVKLKEKNIDFTELDKVIRKYIPSGQQIRESSHDYYKYLNLNALRCINHINLDRAKKSIGTLGGGNHFIECAKGNDGAIYLIIHTGSRHLGKQIAEHYQNKAINNLQSNSKIPKELCYLEGQDLEDYLHDMSIAQFYAKMNREAICDTILKKMNLNEESSFHTSHNYIDMENKILRKGSIAAYKDMKVLIPINMRDGSILAVGKGNPDWNYSAPHGAGRIMSRSEAKKQVTLDEFKEAMKDVFTTSVCSSTLDESPMAYKTIEEIIENTIDTIDIVDILKPLYNYKSN